MELLKLLIVDDEKIILQGMTTTFDWNSIGFQVVGTALNGQEALKIIEEEIPDVVLTDIRMKKMDGITLMERTKRISPNIRFVVLSAYRDFEYAQKACALGALAYIVKPVNDEMLVKMQKVYQQCAAEKQQRNMFQQWQDILADNREGFGAYLIEHYLTDEISLAELKANDTTFTEEELEKHYYTALCVDLDVVYRMKEFRELSAKRFALFSLIEQKIKEDYPVWYMNHPEGARIFIVDLEGNDKLYRLKMLVDNLQKELGFHVISALAESFMGFEGMKKAYAQSLELYYLECELETDFEENDGDAKKSVEYPYETERQIISAIRKNHEKQLKDALIEFLAALGKNESSDKIYLHQLAVHVELMLKEKYGSDDNVRLRFQEFYSSLPRYSTSKLFHMCYELFQYVIEEWKEVIPQGEEQYYNDYVNAACAFVEEHLSEERLSIGQVAEEVHLNPVYFGRVFKSLTHMSFKQYLLKQRVERAKKMLLATEDSIMEISWAVGISNPSYFTKVFKQAVGILPSDYREKYS